MERPLRGVPKKVLPGPYGSRTVPAMVLACSTRCLRIIFSMTVGIILGPFLALWAPKWYPGDVLKTHKKMTSLQASKSDKNTHSKSGCHFFQFGCFFKSGCQPRPGWAPGHHFHRFGIPKVSTITEKTLKCRPCHAHVRILFRSVILPVCLFPFLLPPYGGNEFRHELYLMQPFRFTPPTPPHTSGTSGRVHGEHHCHHAESYAHASAPVYASA